MLISVVTAVYNRASTIGQALDSIHAQTYRPLENIVQDGGSSDGTLDVVRDRGFDTTNLVSAPDKGIYDAINKGIARASGDVIGLMHSDDFFAHDRVLEKVAQAFEDPEVDGVYGDLDYVSAENPDKVIRQWRSGAYDRARMRQGWMPPHPTVYLRRAVFDRWGMYDTSFRIAADYDAMLRYLWRGEIRMAYIPEVMVKMRVGGESNRSVERIVKKSREDYRALRANGVGGVGALLRKNTSKIGQFIIKGS